LTSTSNKKEKGMEMKNDDTKTTSRVFKLPTLDKAKVEFVGKLKGPQEEALKIIEFLEIMEVNTSATLENQHHAIKVKLTLKTKSKNPVYNKIRDMDFTIGMGIDGEYHVWRDR
jgi:hypothetical protein